ncbi:hypothetical protein EDB92DRAFT_1950882 [Lactarius akahatsu]|uniref:Uncharacterized protein n=1 Tax=Lactarius akahatsu TaxID=416441 RepID=A0AAD4QA01_9AGAM|nr:hypothetical protein EDB92DRAFT_1950882 [Lactarius akahatsu]
MSATCLHLHHPGSSESPVKRISRAIAFFAATIPFNTHHEDAGGFQPSNQAGLGRTCEKCPPCRTPQVPTVTALPARKPVATRESTVTATLSQRARPITTPSQHGAPAPPTTPRQCANPAATSTQHGAQVPPRRTPQTMEATGDGSNTVTTTTRQ